MYHISTVILLLLSTAGVLVAIDQQPFQQHTAPTSPFDVDFDAFVANLQQQLHVPGFSIAIVDDGKTYSKGYGYATLPNTKATADTQYFTGSTTKAFTAAIAALLVQDDEFYPDLHWTSPIADFIRGDFVLEGDGYITTHTTIEDALSHRTGLPRHDLMYGQVNDTVASVVQRMRWLPLTAAPRTTWQYCNLMFGVITHVLETVTGRDLETLLGEKFWKPLGMMSTTFTLPTDTSRLAQGYYWSDARGGAESLPGSRKGLFIPEPYLDISPISGAGATISTVNDYALWAKAWLDAASPSPANTSSPINTSLFHDLVTPRTIIQGFVNPGDSADPFSFITPINYALGWLTLKVLGEPIVTHEGGLTGFGTCLYLLPGTQYGIVTMGNTALTSNYLGSIVASRLLIGKLGVAHTAELESELAETLRSVSQASSHAFAGKRLSSEEIQSQRLARPDNVKSSRLPLPGSLSDFAGLYRHPAYGNINLTVGTSASSSDIAGNKKDILVVDLGSRAWSYKAHLVHITDTVFAVQAFSRHGLGDEHGFVWEPVPETLENVAVFKFGLDGEVVETIGIELEDTMVAVAREKEKMGSKGAWKDGMIWFEKV